MALHVSWISTVAAITTSVWKDCFMQEEIAPLVKINSAMVNALINQTSGQQKRAPRGPYYCQWITFSASPISCTKVLFLHFSRHLGHPVSFQAGASE